jgi:hypothetical protein
MLIDDVLLAVIVSGTVLAIAYIRAEFQFARSQRLRSTAN